MTENVYNQQKSLQSVAFEFDTVLYQAFLSFNLNIGTI